MQFPQGTFTYYSISFFTSFTVVHSLPILLLLLYSRFLYSSSSSSYYHRSTVQVRSHARAELKKNDRGIDIFAELDDYEAQQPQESKEEGGKQNRLVVDVPNGGGDLAGPEPVMVPPPAQPITTTSMSSTTAAEDINNKRSADEITSGGDDTTTGPTGGLLVTAKQKRDRNRDSAKRSHLRKRFLVESLQEQIHGLQEQLDKFKKTIRDEIPAPKAETLNDAICGHENQYTPLTMPSGFGPVKTLMEPDFKKLRDDQREDR